MKESRSKFFSLGLERARLDGPESAADPLLAAAAAAAAAAVQKNVRKETLSILINT